MAHKDSSASEASASESSASEASASEASSSESSSSSSETKKKVKSKKSKKGKKVEKTSKKSKTEKKEKKSKSKKSKGDKKEKKSKDGKRGPKGAQWLSWKIPFQEKSILGSSFQMAAKKGGIDEKKLVHHIKKNKGNPAFMLRILKRGYNRGWKWEVDDAHGRLRILNSKIDKHYKKAA